MVAQCVAVSLLAALVAISYVTIPYTAFPVSHYYLLTFLWQFMQGSHNSYSLTLCSTDVAGANSFIYIALNKSLRNAVKVLFKTSKDSLALRITNISVSNKTSGGLFCLFPTKAMQRSF